MRNACPEGAACVLALLLVAAPTAAQPGSMTAEAARAFLRRLQPSPLEELRLARLISDLGAERFVVRENAERTLKAFGRGARGALATATRRGSPEVRDRAMRILGGMSDEGYERNLFIAFEAVGRSGQPGSAAALLAALLSCTTPSLRDCAARQLAAAARPGDAEALREAMVAEDADTREIVVRALGLRPDLGLGADLRQRLADPVDAVRLEAARALAVREDRAALATLVDLLASSDVHVRSRAHGVLCALTRRKSSYVAWDEASRRRPAMRDWQRWLDAEGATARLWLPLGKARRYGAIEGFLLSVSANGLRLYGRDGVCRWDMPAAPYDAHACGDVFVLSERNEGVVRVVDHRKRTLRRIQGLSSPVDADLLPNGNLLVLENAGRVLEYDARGRVVWQKAGLNNPFDATRLPNGNTLVADSGADRLVEFDPSGREVWVVNNLAFPNGVLRLDTGETIYTTYTTGSVVMLDRRGRKVWETAVPGATLYSPEVAEGRVWVADSAGKQIVVLDMKGREVSRIQLPESFVDVSFVR